jgi:hypothetical protein
MHLHFPDHYNASHASTTSSSDRDSGYVSSSSGAEDVPPENPDPKVHVKDDKRIFDLN